MTIEQKLAKALDIIDSLCMEMTLVMDNPSSSDEYLEAISFLDQDARDDAAMRSLKRPRTIPESDYD